MSIVLGYVPTPEGEAAFAAAVDEARLRGLRLILVNTSRGDALVDPRYVLDDDVPALEQRLQETGVEHRVVHVASGQEAADEVLLAAEKYRADLIVIGLRRRSPVGKLIMGSTAQRILLGARCHVLAVKAGGPS